MTANTDINISMLSVMNNITCFNDFSDHNSVPLIVSVLAFFVIARDLKDDKFEHGTKTIEQSTEYTECYCWKNCFFGEKVKMETTHTINSTFHTHYYIHKLVQLIVKYTQ